MKINVVHSDVDSVSTDTSCNVVINLGELGNSALTTHDAVSTDRKLFMDRGRSCGSEIGTDLWPAGRIQYRGEMVLRKLDAEASLEDACEEGPPFVVMHFTACQVAYSAIIPLLIHGVTILGSK